MECCSTGRKTDSDIIVRSFATNMSRREDGNRDSLCAEATKECENPREMYALKWTLMGLGVLYAAILGYDSDWNHGGMVHLIPL